MDEQKGSDVQEEQNGPDIHIQDEQKGSDVQEEQNGSDFQRILILMIHKTLGKEHVDMCLEALSKQQNDGVRFNLLLIYNTNTEDVPNEYVVERLSHYNLERLIDSARILMFEGKSITLVEDTVLIGNYLLDNFKKNDRVLLLKADILLSRGYLSELKKTDTLQKNLFYIVPLYNAKKSVTDDELRKMIDSDTVIRSSPEIFFTEDENYTTENDFRDRLLPTFEDLCKDPTIKYISSTGKRDWTCPYLSVGLFENIGFTIQHWGGWNAEENRPYFLGAYRSFIVHKYHPLRSGVRPGAYGEWIES